MPQTIKDSVVWLLGARALSVDVELLQRVSEQRLHPWGARCLVEEQVSTQTATMWGHGGYS